MAPTTTAGSDLVNLGPDVVAEFLGSTRAFQQCEAALLVQVARHLECRRYAANTVILRAGSAATVMGVVFSGRLSARLVNAVTGAHTVQQDFRVGDHFGEIAMLLDSAQPHEIAAEADSTVLLVPVNVYRRLTSGGEGFALSLAKALAAQLVRAGMSTIGSARPQVQQRQPESPPLATPQPALPAALPEGAIPFVRTASYNVDEQIAGLVPAESILQHRFIPLKLDGDTLTVGMVDPHNTTVINELDRILNGVKLDIAAISQDDYMASLVRLRLETGRPKHRGEGFEGSVVSYEKEDREKEADSALGVIGNEVVTLVDKIFVSGIERGASDIHIEEQRSDIKIRFRINGMLRDHNEYIPASFGRGLIARIKILSGLDITEQRRPQDGRVGMRIGRRDLDFRVSTMPTSHGEKVVMRMFEASNMMRPLEQIFIAPDTLKVVKQALGRPYGAIIVAGPTGSGKSSTLYACLNERRVTRPDTNICLVEDPIEYRLQGVTQVQVNYAVDLTFAAVLRTFLRQDPDVIMVGEMRDAETATIGLEAAMTGHLVFSSFHANNATAAIQRLENFGCNRTMIAQSVALILIQRLVRRLCPLCAVMAEAPPALARSLSDRGLIDRSARIQLPKAGGCKQCDNTGYAGRVAVIESLKVDEDISAALMADQRLDEIERLAMENGLMVPFGRYASFLMARKIIASGDALLAVAT